MSAPVFDPPKILTLKKKVNPTLCSCISPCEHPYKPEMEQTEIHRFYVRSETGQSQKTTAALIRKRIEAARFIELKSYVYGEARNDDIRRDKSHLIGAFVAQIKDEDIDRFVECFSSDGVIIINDCPLPIWCRQNFVKPNLSAILKHDDTSNAKKKASGRAPERVKKEQPEKIEICKTTDKLMERNKSCTGKSAHVHFKEEARSDNIVRNQMDEHIENIDAQRIKITEIRARTEADDIMNAVLLDVGREIERKEHERACETVNDLLLDLLNNVDRETRNREEIIVKETVCNFMDMLMANVEADICRLAEQKQREHELKIAQIKADKEEWAVHELTMTVIDDARRELFIEDEEKIDGLVRSMVEEVVTVAFLEVNDECDRILNGIVSQLENKAIIDAQTEMTDEYEQDLYVSGYRMSRSVIACVEAEENQEFERRLLEKVNETSERVISDCLNEIVKEQVAAAFQQVNNEYKYDRNLNGIVSELSNKAIKDAESELQYEYEQDLYETAYNISRSVIACAEAEENQEIERRSSEKVKEMSERVITDCLNEIVKEQVAAAFQQVNNEYKYDRNLNGIISELSNKAIKDAESELQYEYEQDLYETAYNISSSVIAGVEAEENQEFERRSSEKVKEMSERVITDCLNEIVNEQVAAAFQQVNNEYKYDRNLNDISSELSNKAIKDAESEPQYEYEKDLYETAYNISISIIVGVEAEENQEFERRLSEKANEMSKRVISDVLSELTTESEKQLWQTAFPNTIATDKVTENNEKNNKNRSKTTLDLTNIISTEAVIDNNKKAQKNVTSKDQFARNQIDDAEVCVDSVGDIQETFQKVTGDILAEGDLNTGNDETDETGSGQINEVVPDFKKDRFEEKEENQKYLENELMGEISPGAQRENKEKQSAINEMAAETKREFEIIYKIKYTEAKSVDQQVTEDENTDGKEDTTKRETVLKMYCHKNQTDSYEDMYEHNMFRIAYEQDVAADVTELAHQSNATVSEETETDIIESCSLMTPQDDVTEISPSFGIMALYVNSELHAFWGRE